MRFSIVASALLAYAATVLSAPSPSDFKVVNMLRTVDLMKAYVRDSSSFILENTSSEPKSSFYLAVNSSYFDDDETTPKLAMYEVKLKADDASTTPLEFEIAPEVNEDGMRLVEVALKTPLEVGSSQTIQLVTAVVRELSPIPKKIKQSEPQNLMWEGTKVSYMPYPIVKQRTKVKTADRPPNAYSKHIDDPLVEGTTLTYGPYNDVEPYAYDPILVKYEYNIPVIEVSKLERELWVSHTGGNLATEERYWLKNAGAELKDNFSRIRWQASTMARERTPALRSASVHLRPGVRDVYFTDEIGNVSTSNFRDDPRSPIMEIRPRYPIFGGWNYSFTLGWNHDLGRSLRSLVDSEGETVYVLRVPLIEGLMNVYYNEVEVSVVLPEAAEILSVESTYTDVTEERSLLFSHLDAVGRTVVKLKAKNMIDEQKRSELYVTYTLPSNGQYAKPMLVATALITVFFAVIVLGRIDISIGKTKTA
ncbi:Ribophorin I [Myxozyma melibiosi]|uniref:Dolichyl-diphosphooligosaccharide--protein glycosyltransferase subunit 1 n=1 Tax=Myxozyma melibiosi TaxID=54550 RepID=A0ABR1F252_9ASCO